MAALIVLIAFEIVCLFSPVTLVFARCHIISLPSPFEIICVRNESFSFVNHLVHWVSHFRQGHQGVTQNRRFSVRLSLKGHEGPLWSSNHEDQETRPASIRESVFAQFKSWGSARRTVTGMFYATP